jgi:hypothetical protein
MIFLGGLNSETACGAAIIAVWRPASERVCLRRAGASPPWLLCGAQGGGGAGRGTSQKPSRWAKMQRGSHFVLPSGWRREAWGGVALGWAGGLGGGALSLFLSLSSYPVCPASPFHSQKKGLPSPWLGAPRVSFPFQKKAFRVPGWGRRPWGGALPLPPPVAHLEEREVELDEVEKLHEVARVPMGSGSLRYRFTK